MLPGLKNYSVINEMFLFYKTSNNKLDAGDFVHIEDAFSTTWEREFKKSYPFSIEQNIWYCSYSSSHCLLINYFYYVIINYYIINQLLQKNLALYHIPSPFKKFCKSLHFLVLAWPATRDS